MRDNKYIEFERAEEQETGKTEVWGVWARRDGTTLGSIRWFGRWRQYVFFPAPGTVFNPDCLDAINDKIRSLMAGRRTKKLREGV